MDFQNNNFNSSNNDDNFNYYGSVNNDNNFNIDPGNSKPPKGGPGVKTFASLVVAIIVVCGIVIGIAFHDADNTIKSSESKSNKNSSSSGVVINDTPDSKVKSGKGDRLSSVEVAKKASDSVIAIEAYKNGKLVSEGSGVVMGLDESKNNTYIITCAHIIDEEGTAPRIQTKDGKQYPASVVGYDKRTDIAVLKAKVTGLKAAEFGDSSKLQVGETIYAIGNPGGADFYGSFTGGVVSAIDRITPTGKSGYSMSCIQHDAAINPGNSGGALVNEFGQVVGINSSKIADTEYEGMGFAVPMSVAKDVVDKIIANGYVPDRPKLGIKYAPNKYNETYISVVKKNKLPNGTIVVAEIDKSSSLNGTQAKVGDMIYAVNGKQLEEADIILKEIENSKVGDELELSMCHVNKDLTINKYTLKVKLAEDRAQ